MSEKIKSKEVFVIAYSGVKNSVMYETNKNNIYRCYEGSRSWRNNNPGNIRYGDFTKRHGHIGQAAGFACFPDKEKGKKALTALLKTNSYQKGTVRDAIHRYAPPVENDTESYIKHVEKELGVRADTPMSE